MGKLVTGGVFTEDTPIDKAAGLLERYIPAEEGVASHLLLQALSEDASFDPAKLLAGKKTTARKAPAAKKTGTRKRARASS